MYKKKNITQMCVVDEKNTDVSRDRGRVNTGNDSISSAFLEPLLYELMCRLCIRHRAKIENRNKSQSVSADTSHCTSDADRTLSLHIYIILTHLLYFEHLLHLLFLTLRKKVIDLTKCVYWVNSLVGIFKYLI